jgi:Flp pilus assembly pilin Flp
MTRPALSVMKQFITGEEAASVVEYALLLLLLVVVTFAVIGLLGRSLSKCLGTAAATM